MTAKGRTSSKNKRPGVYVDAHAAAREGKTAFQAMEKAKKFQSIRAAQKGRKRAAEEDGSDAEEELKQNTEAAAGANAAAAAASAAAAAAAASPAAAAAALPSTISSLDDAFQVAFTPFVSSSSSAVATTAESSLKDDRVLGVALWEWLLARPDWDCHALWEKFLVDWDLITETERPPGTNRPINLHGYLTYLRSTNNKAVVRKDVRLCRATLLAEREAHLAAHPEDPRARPNVEALNGTLLNYYLKVKNLMPYENEKQRARKEAKRKRMEQFKQQQAEGGQAAEGEEGAAAAAAADPASSDAVDDAVVDAAPQPPRRKKGKHAHIAAAAAATPSASSASAPSTTAPTTSAVAARPPRTGTLNMGDANAFAALLDCD